MLTQWPFLAELNIVAAAGNNNSSEPLFPCAYEGVICVASSTLDGSVSTFSNFGAHVDVVAPGEAIVSLNPTIYEPDLFAIPGYELRSGTSQSAPVVAALIASLLGDEPNLTREQILGRIYSLPKKTNKEKFTMGGDVTWTGLKAPVRRDVIRPVFKRVRQVQVRNGAVTKITVPLKNYGEQSGPFTLKLSSSRSGVKISDEVKSVEGMKAGEALDVAFDVEVSNMLEESQMTLKLTIEQNGESLMFLNDIPVAKDLRNDSALKKFGFVFADKPIRLGAPLASGGLGTVLITTPSFGVSKGHDFHVKRTITKENEPSKLEVLVFQRKGPEYVQGKTAILIENGVSLFDFRKIDLNLDGKEDYFLQVLCEDKNKKQWYHFGFYDRDLKPLWKDFNDIRFEFDISVSSMANSSFVKFQHAKLGAMMVPAFFSAGQLPKIDQVITTWERYDLSKRNHLYYLEPTDKAFRVRSLTTTTWAQAFLKELKTKWFETVEVENVLPESPQDIAKGELRVLVSVGLDSKRQIFIHTLSPNKASHGAKLPQLILRSRAIDTYLGISPDGLESKGEVYSNIYDTNRTKLVTTKDEKQIGEYVYSHDDELDPLMSHLVSFEKGSGRFSILETRDELVSISFGEKVKTSKRKKIRYSFLTQAQLNEFFVPVMFERNGNKIPGLYVDSTTITGNRVSVYEDQNGELVSSIENSLLLPPDCKTLTPQFFSESKTYSVVLLCLEANDWFIRTYQLK